MFLKRLLALLTVLIIGILNMPTVLAEEIYFWTTREEPYYHADKNCGGSVVRFPLSKDAAVEFDKNPCPLCGMEVDAKEIEILAGVRAGTYVFCIPQALLDAVEVESIANFTTSRQYSGAEANAVLLEILGDTAYRDFMSEYALYGQAQTTYRAVQPVENADWLNMNLRRIGDNWYLLVDPNQAFSEENPLEWRIVEISIIWDAAGAVTLNVEGEQYRRDYIPSQSMSNAEPVFKRDYGTLDISVFREIGANIAVLHVKNEDPDVLTGEVRIGDTETEGIDVSGYINGNTATYCCVLTDAELGALVAGSSIGIFHESVTEKVVFNNGPYAPVRKGDGMGLIDKTGSFAIKPEYLEISDGKFYDSYADKSAFSPFFCRDTEGNITVLDPITLDVIGSYKQEGACQMVGIYENPSVFLLSTTDKHKVCDMKTGEVLWETPAVGSFQGHSGVRTFNVLSISGIYDGFVEGLPQRLAVTLGRTPDTIAWLTDNYGNRKTEDFYNLSPLVWHDNVGVFAYQPLNEVGNGDALWGLIDHNGNVLVEAQYISIRALSPTQFELRSETELKIVTIKPEVDAGNLTANENESALDW